MRAFIPTPVIREVEVLCTDWLNAQPAGTALYAHRGQRHGKPGYWVSTEMLEPFNPHYGDFTMRAG